MGQILEKVIQRTNQAMYNLNKRPDERKTFFVYDIPVIFFSRYEQALDTHIFLWLGEILCIWPQCMVCFYTILYMPIYYLMPFITPFCAKGETDTPNLLICFQFMSILKLLATFRTIKNIKNECVWYLEDKNLYVIFFIQLQAYYRP